MRSHSARASLPCHFPHFFLLCTSLYIAYLSCSMSDYFPTSPSLPFHSRTAQPYPDSLFTGCFSRHSPEYLTSVLCGRVPVDNAGYWACEQRLITYYTMCVSHEPCSLFWPNQPIVLMTGMGDCCHCPFALYAIVWRMSVWNNENIEHIHYAITVKVHTTLGFQPNWSIMFPHPSPPDSTIFLCPHNFQGATHHPVPLTHIPLIQVPQVQFNLQKLHQQIVVDLCPEEYTCPFHSQPPQSFNGTPLPGPVMVSPPNNIMTEQEDTSDVTTPTPTSATPTPLTPADNADDSPMPTNINHTEHISTATETLDGSSSHRVAEVLYHSFFTD